MENVVRTRWVDETRGLLAVNFLEKMSVKESIFDIKLVYGTIVR